MMNATVLSQNAQISANQDIKRTGIKVIEDILSSLLNGNSVYLPFTSHGVSEVDEKLYMVVVIPGNIEIYEPRIIDNYSSSYPEIMGIGVTPTHIDIKKIYIPLSLTTSICSSLLILISIFLRQYIFIIPLGLVASFSYYFKTKIS